MPLAVAYSFFESLDGTRCHRWRSSDGFQLNATRIDVRNSWCVGALKDAPFVVHGFVPLPSSVRFMLRVLARVLATVAGSCLQLHPSILHDVLDPEPLQLHEAKLAQASSVANGLRGTADPVTIAS